MTASSQKWKLVVTKLGGADILHEQELEASNWMGALRSARQTMGERASVPPGASCSIDGEGTATVLDPASRRKFVLRPIADVPAPSVGAAAKPAEVPAAPAPTPAPRPTPGPAPRPPPGRVAAPPPAPPPAAGAVRTAAKKRRFETVAFVPEPLAPPAPPPAPPPAKKKGKFQTVAYMPGVAMPEAAAPPREANAPSAAAQAASGPTPSRQPVSAPAPQAPPTDSRSAPVASNGGRSRVDSPVPRAPAVLSELMSRNVEPTPDNPLTYCERAYLLPNAVTITDAEAAMRFKLADIQAQLEQRPRGKFVNLALFDHPWQDVPKRPPLIVLQWRDWRDEVLVDYPATQLARAASTQAADDRLDEVFEALDGLSRLSSAADGLEFAVRLLERVLPAEATSGCIYDINTDELRFVSLAGASATSLQGKAIPRSAGLFGVAVRSDEQATVVTDVATAPDFDPETDGRLDLEARNMLLRPLTHEGQLLGMLQLINRVGASAFSATDVHLVNYLADRLSEFLRDVRARQQ